MIRTQLINRYNVYKNGKQLIGVAGELTLPEVTNLTDSMEGAGTGGNMDVPVIGLIDELEMGIPFMSLCQDTFSIMDPTESADLTLNGAIQGADPGTGSKMNSSLTLGLSYYKIVVNGKTQLEIDRYNGVYKVNGKDIMKEVRDMC